MSRGLHNCCGAASPASILAGSFGTSTITITALNGLTGTVSLSASASNPAGLTCTLPSSVTFGSSPQTATLACSAAAAADYTVTVTGTDGTLSHTTATILFHIVDFTVSRNPNSLSIKHGNSGSSTISLSSLNGFSGTVTLTASVDPSVSNKPTPSFSPTSVTLTPNGSGSSTLTISTSPNTPKQGYTVTVTATSGSLVHTVTITVTVT